MGACWDFAKDIAAWARFPKGRRAQSSGRSPAPAAGYRMLRVAAKQHASLCCCMACDQRRMGRKAVPDQIWDQRASVHQVKGFGSGGASLGKVSHALVTQPTAVEATPNAVFRISMAESCAVWLRKIVA